MPQPFIIAIDGHSSCGKSTFAKLLARKLGYIYIDTGAMYRAVTLHALRTGCFESGVLDTEKLQKALTNLRIDFRKMDNSEIAHTFLNGEDVETDIRGLEVSHRVSEVSAQKMVREQMVEQQRAMSRQKGVILDGRDIGTVVFPDAELKLFMTADADVRAQRRYDELVQKGMVVNFDEIKRNILERDHLDSTREESPLRKADDALVLDNSYMTPDEQLEWVMKIIDKL